MIGSHNTLSYLPPKNLWGKITRPWNKCQDKNIREQYEAGIRYFDIRINLYDDDKWHFVHNKVDFGPTYELIWRFIAKRKIPIRLIYDQRSKPKDVNYKIARFKTYINILTEKYDVDIDSAITYWDWKEYSIADIDIKEYHASVSAKWYQYILGCKWFALTYPCTFKDFIASNNSVLLLDYV